MNRVLASLLLLAIAASSPLLAADAPPATAPATSPSPASQPIARKFAVTTFGNARGMAVDKAGNLYVGDTDGGKIVKITPAGEVSAIGGAGASLISDPLALGAAPDGTIYAADASGSAVFKIPPGGAAQPATSAAGSDLVHTPTGAAIDAAGTLFVCNNADNVVIRITPAGAASVFAGKSGESGAADGKGDAARFMTPRALAIDAKGNLYLADEGNSNIRKITPDGVVTTLAGDPAQSGHADGAGKAATFSAPRSIAASADGTVFVADTDNHTIRKISPAGVVTTLAGKPGESGDADGTGDKARFSEPRGVAVDAAGCVYVADTGNGLIRQITPDGAVTTIAGAKPPATRP